MKAEVAQSKAERAEKKQKQQENWDKQHPPQQNTPPLMPTGISPEAQQAYMHSGASAQAWVGGGPHTLGPVISMDANSITILDTGTDKTHTFTKDEFMEFWGRSSQVQVPSAPWLKLTPFFYIYATKYYDSNYSRYHRLFSKHVNEYTGVFTDRCATVYSDVHTHFSTDRHSDGHPDEYTGRFSDGYSIFHSDPLREQSLDNGKRYSFFKA